MSGLLNEKEVARLLGLAVQTLRNQRHRDQGLAYVKLGKSVRYRADDVERYVAERRVEPGNR